MTKEEAIKIIKDNWPESRHQLSEALQTLIPEFQENEDEKIRKELIDYLKERSHSGFNKEVRICNDGIAWLEKQGSITKLSEEEQNSIAYGVLTSCASAFIDYLDAHKYEGKMCVSNGECEDIENAFHNAMFDKLHRYYCKYIEKQGEQKVDKCKDCNNVKGCIICTNGDQYAHITEQKPAGKAEPKFKVGDWITSTCGGITFQIIKIENEYYIADDGDKVFIKLIDKHYHLWTIQDAKDGDVLAVNWYEGDDFWEKIIILKRYHNKGVKGLLNSPCVEGYGNTFKNEKLVLSKEVPYYSKTLTANLHPATKEQRDLLFQKMGEAGYEWDSKEKKLKKIEQKSAWSEEDKEYISSFIDVIDMFYTLSGELETLTKINVFRKEYAEMLKSWLKSLKDRVQPQLKQEWSEEDKRISIEIKCLISNYRTGDDEHKLCSWIDNLKERVQPQQKQEWSEEDKKHLLGCINYFSGITESSPYYNDFLWLKSLKKRMKGE